MANVDHKKVYREHYMVLRRDDPRVWATPATLDLERATLDQLGADLFLDGFDPYRSGRGPDERASVGVDHIEEGRCAAAAGSSPSPAEDVHHPKTSPLHCGVAEPVRRRDPPRALWWS